MSIDTTQDFSLFGFVDKDITKSKLNSEDGNLKLYLSTSQLMNMANPYIEISLEELIMLGDLAKKQKLFNLLTT